MNGAALVDVEIASISPASEIARRCRDTWSTYPILKLGDIENFQSINICSIFTAYGKHTCDVLGIIQVSKASYRDAELTKLIKGHETEKRELLQRSNMKDIVPVKGITDLSYSKSMIFHKWP